jgi:hypothetical protein
VIFPLGYDKRRAAFFERRWNVIEYQIIPCRILSRVCVQFGSGEGSVFGLHSLNTRSALRKHTASRSAALKGAVSMNWAASSLSSSG